MTLADKLAVLAFQAALDRDPEFGAAPATSLFGCGIFRII
jgi:hypothetical protein